MFVPLFSSSLLPPSLFPRWRLPLRRRTTPLIHRLSFALSPTCKKCRLVRCFPSPTVAGFRQLMTFDRRDLPCSLPRERGPMRSRVYKNRPIGAWGLLHTHLALPGQQCYKEKHLHDFEMLSLLKAGSSRILCNSQPCLFIQYCNCNTYKGLNDRQKYPRDPTLAKERKLIQDRNVLIVESTVALEVSYFIICCYFLVFLNS